MKIIVAFEFDTDQPLIEIEKRILEIHSEINPDLIIIDGPMGSEYLLERLQMRGIRCTSGNIGRKISELI